MLNHEITVLKDLVYDEHNQHSCKLDIAFPSRSVSPRPCICIFHGGGWVEGNKSSFSDEVSNPFFGIQTFARHNFVCASIGYRLSGEAKWPAALIDCEKALNWLLERSKDFNLDPKKIGLYGNSAGGHLAMMLMNNNVLRSTSKFANDTKNRKIQAIVSDSGILDMVETYKNNLLSKVIENFLGNPLNELSWKLYCDASPRNWLNKNQPSCFLIYGAKDNQVPISQADKYVFDALESGIENLSYLRLENAGHCPLFLEKSTSLAEYTIQFFKKKLFY